MTTAAMAFRLLAVALAGDDGGVRRSIEDTRQASEQAAGGIDEDLPVVNPDA